MNKKYIPWMLGAVFMIVSLAASAMGLRSFVALPLEERGVVLRVVDIDSLEDNKNRLVAELAYGLSGTQTLLFGLPYRLSPSGKHRSGDLSALYRHTFWQKNFQIGTHRLAFLGGGLIPTHHASDGSIQGGLVATFYRDRYEFDIDGLWIQGLGQSPNQALYDVSWQYRLLPSFYPETGLGSQLNSVMEYNGRWKEKEHLVHQTTLGLQWVHPTWVLEGGWIKDVNVPHDSQLLMSVRFHI